MGLSVNVAIQSPDDYGIEVQITTNTFKRGAKMTTHYILFGFLAVVTLTTIALDMKRVTKNTNF